MILDLTFLLLCQTVKMKFSWKFWSLKFEKASKVLSTLPRYWQIDNLTKCSSYGCLIARSQTHTGELGAAGLFVYICTTWWWKKKVLREVIYKLLQTGIEMWQVVEEFGKIEIREFKSIRNKSI